MVRAAGVEPASHAWEAHILPIYYARAGEHEDGCEGIGPSASENRGTPKPRPNREKQPQTGAQRYRYPRLPSSALFRVTASA